MAFVSATYLRIRTQRVLLPFMWANMRILSQLRVAPGFVVGGVAPDVRRGAYWTITVWHDRPSMLAFRNAGVHLRAMPKLLTWCDEASVAAWEQETAQLPSPEAVLTRMREEGRLSKVARPSSAQAAGLRAADARAPQVAMVVRPRAAR